MLPEITLVAGTAVDWPRFVSAVNTALGRSPTRELDNCGLKVGSPATYIASLGEFTKPGTNPITVLKDADRLLAHVNLTFLVAVDRDTALSLLKHSLGLSVLSSEPSRGRENLLITASLRDWRTAVLEACTPNSDPDVRTFFNSVWKVLDGLGFRDIFHRYQRKDLKDYSFALEYRRGT